MRERERESSCSKHLFSRVSGYNQAGEDHESTGRDTPAQIANYQITVEMSSPSSTYEIELEFTADFHETGSRRIAFRPNTIPIRSVVRASPRGEHGKELLISVGRISIRPANPRSRRSLASNGSAVDDFSLPAGNMDENHDTDTTRTVNGSYGGKFEGNAHDGGSIVDGFRIGRSDKTGGRLIGRRIYYHGGDLVSLLHMRTTRVYVYLYLFPLRV